MSALSALLCRGSCYGFSMWVAHWIGSDHMITKTTCHPQWGLPAAQALMLSDVLRSAIVEWLCIAASCLCVYRMLSNTLHTPVSPETFLLASYSNSCPDRPRVCPAPLLPFLASNPPAVLSCRCGQRCYLLIGPEGDFTSDEVAQLSEAGVLPVGLGPNRLRTETAAIAALSAAMLVADSSSSGSSSSLPAWQGNGLLPVH